LKIKFRSRVSVSVDGMVKVVGWVRIRIEVIVIVMVRVRIKIGNRLGL